MELTPEEERRRELREFGPRRDIARKAGREHRKALAAAAQERAEEAIRLVANLAGVDVAILTEKDRVRLKLLPDEKPTQFDYLHAIRAVAARCGNKQIFDLADAGMMLSDRREDDSGG